MLLLICCKNLKWLQKTFLCDILSTGYSPGTFSEKQIRMGHCNLFLTKLCWLIPTSFLLSASKLFLCSEELELTWQVYPWLSSPFSCLQKTVTLLCHLSGSSPVLLKLKKKKKSLTASSLIESELQKEYSRFRSFGKSEQFNVSNQSLLSSGPPLLVLNNVNSSQLTFYENLCKNHSSQSCCQ